MSKWIRHGDVVIQKINKVPGNVTLNKVDNAVLAEGEVTGHFHRLSGELLFAETGDTKYFSCDTELLLSHEEHDTLTIPKGVYEVKLQREVDLLGEVRTVVD